MSELLRMANEIVDAKAKVLGEDAAYFLDGYQRLVKAALLLLEHAHFTKEWRQLETVAELWIKTAKESIPGVSDSQDHTNEES